MARFYNAHLPAHWHLQHLRIGVRLRLAFACVLLLMFLGCSVSLWHLAEVRKGLERASLADRRMLAVLQLHNSTLAVMNRLYRAADTQDPAYFGSEASRLLAVLRSDTAGVTNALHSHSPGPDRQAVIIDSLSAMFDAFPARIGSLVELAGSGDWAAVNARLLNQVDHTDDVVSALVRQMDADLSEARRRMLDEIHRAQRNTAQILGATSLLSLLAAAFLGIVVTRSITRPLADLDDGARALAQGHFGTQVAVTGNDELSHLAKAFNQTTRRLEDLYTKVQRSEAQFRSLIEKASDLIVVAGREGEILYASPSSIRVLGYPPEKLTGRFLQDLVHPEESSLAHRVFAGDGPATGDTRPFELRFRHQDGSFRILEGLASHLLDDPVVAGIVVNARDISDRRQAEEILRTREDQLRQAQKMEAIGRLAGGVAHDFNNLLTIINGYSELLLSAAKGQDANYVFAREIRDAGERAVHLTRQLLVFSRRQVLRPTVLNLNDIVRDTERMLRRVIGEDVELVCRLDPSGGEIEADPNQLRQVLMNLSVNARDAMPNGGKLTIETASAEFDAACAANEQRPGRYVTLIVSDTGHGMDEATQRQMFEPFFTTKEHGKGTGLGLSIVYGIVSQSGGWIAVDSAEDRGTTFRIHFPRVERPVAVAEVTSDSPAPGGTETILLVEDETEVRRFAALSLRTLGYQVIEASSGEEALRLYQDHTEPIDLLLTDVVMPGMTGVELAKQLHSLNPGVKVIFASGYADSTMLRHGVLDAGVSLLQKPYTPSVLATEVRKALDPPNQAVAIA